MPKTLKEFFSKPKTMKLKCLFCDFEVTSRHAYKALRKHLENCYQSWCFKDGDSYRCQFCNNGKYWKDILCAFQHFEAKHLEKDVMDFMKVEEHPSEIIPNPPTPPKPRNPPSPPSQESDTKQCEHCKETFNFPDNPHGWNSFERHLVHCSKYGDKVESNDAGFWKCKLCHAIKWKYNKAGRICYDIWGHVKKHDMKNVEEINNIGEKVKDVIEVMKVEDDPLEIVQHVRKVCELVKVMEDLTSELKTLLD